VVAMCILFRKPLTDFVSWLGNWGKSIGQFFTNNVTTPISNAWKTMVEFLPRAMDAIGNKVQSIFTGIVNTVKNSLRNVLLFIANAVNSVGRQVNRLIGAFNNLPGPNIPFVPALSVPAFAKGGYVTGPTLGMVGEGGQPEYIIPASRMASASSAFLSGARGTAVLNSNGGGGSSASPIVNITTGPVMQAAGQSWVTLTDLERATKQTAEQVFSILRTPAGRRAVGIA